jgi:outer membrane murein-binding lipoprotein Lpp
MKIRQLYLAAVFLLALLLSGCTSIKLVGDYDAQTDKGITALQKDMEVFFVTLESAEGSMAAPYAANKDFYGQTKVAISSLRIRADALERNSFTVRMFDKLQNNFDRLAADHREGISKRELPLYRGGLNSQFTSLLTFELAKRRGQKFEDARALAPATPPIFETGLSR